MEACSTSSFLYFLFLLKPSSPSSYFSLLRGRERQRMREMSESTSASVSWYTEQMLTMSGSGLGLRWGAGMQSRSPTRLAGTQSFERLPLTPRVAGSWSQELELSIKPRHSDVDVGIWTTRLQVYSLYSSFLSVYRKLQYHFLKHKKQSMNMSQDLIFYFLALLYGKIHQEFYICLLSLFFFPSTEPTPQSLSSSLFWRNVSNQWPKNLLLYSQASSYFTKF